MIANTRSIAGIQQILIELLEHRAQCQQLLFLTLSDLGRRYWLLAARRIGVGEH
jgi:hypothetical protein